MPDPTPKPPIVKFRLKGYALRNPKNGMTEGYFRSLKDSIPIFDPGSNRKISLLINYRSQGDDYYHLWGFKYRPGERVIHCGLEEVVLTVDHSGQEKCVDIVTPPPPRKSYETKFLSTVAGSIAQKVAEVESNLPLPSKSLPSNFNLVGFPEEFQDEFRIGIKESRAFSFKEIYVSVNLRELGVMAKGVSNPGYSAVEVCGGCYHRRPNKA